MFCPSGGLSVTKALSVLKVPAGSRVKVGIQSERPELLVTHWFGRQFVCGGGDCPACGTYASRLGVWNVVQVVVGNSLQPRLLELSSQSWARLRFMAGWEDAESLGGVAVELYRSSLRRPVLAEPCSDVIPVNSRLASADTLLDGLGVLFQLPARRDGESGVEWADRIRPVVVSRVERAMLAAG